MCLDNRGVIGTPASYATTSDDVLEKSGIVNQANIVLIKNSDWISLFLALFALPG